jgi:putative tricarboxylic transport membrane protein
VAPRISKLISVPKNILLPVVTVLCVIGSFACNNRLFDVALMFLFGLLGFLMRRRGYPAAPLVLALVLGKTMDSNFRRAVSLASVADNKLASMFWHPITMILLILTVIVVLGNIPFFKKMKKKDLQ